MPKYQTELPTDAVTYLKEAVFEYDRYTNTLSTATASDKMQIVAPALMVLAKFEYLIRDTEAEGRSTTELAFEHLKRSIVVDERVRNDWEKALTEREERSEQLGAVHLLSHGIWAFKVTGAGAATDLIYSDPIDAESPALRRTARALVLTEWKKASTETEVATAAATARKQAELYASGLLGDIELKRTRYVVIVSPRHLDAPADVTIGRVTYRHIIIPVTKVTPSVAARKLV